MFVCLNQLSRLDMFVVVIFTSLRSMTYLSLLMFQWHSSLERTTGSRLNWKKHVRLGLPPRRLTRMEKKLTPIFLSICPLHLGTSMQRGRYVIFYSLFNAHSLAIEVWKLKLLFLFGLLEFKTSKEMEARSKLYPGMV